MTGDLLVAKGAIFTHATPNGMTVGAAVVPAAVTGGEFTGGKIFIGEAPVKGCGCGQQGKDEEYQDF